MGSIAPFVGLTAGVEQFAAAQQGAVVDMTKAADRAALMGSITDAMTKGFDDGAGAVMSMEAINVLRKMKLIPRRTIRVVLFTNEENGLRGGKAYAAKGRPGERPIAAIESDAGGFTPRDARLAYVVLTKAGQQLITNARATLEGLSADTLDSLDASALTALNASALASGTLPDARLAGTYSGALTFSGPITFSSNAVVNASQLRLGNFGALGRNTHRANGQADFDWNVYKNTRINERVALIEYNHQIW